MEYRYRYVMLFAFARSAARDTFSSLPPIITNHHGGQFVFFAPTVSTIPSFVFSFSSMIEYSVPDRVILLLYSYRPSESFDIHVLVWVDYWVDGTIPAFIFTFSPSLAWTLAVWIDWLLESGTPTVAKLSVVCFCPVYHGEILNTKQVRFYARMRGNNRLREHRRTEHALRADRLKHLYK